MSEPQSTAKNFLLRWSQRKHAAQQRAEHVAGDEDSRRSAADPAHTGSAGEAAAPAFDPETLPSIESITAISDVRAFLAPGVPDELTRAALRRVWVSDPTIRDFVGIAENQWDFTLADGAPGFGPLQLTPQLRKMIADLVGDGGGEIGPEAPPPYHGADSSTAEYPIPPTGCAELDRPQKASSPAPDVLAAEFGSAEDALTSSPDGDHAAPQQSSGGDATNNTTTEHDRPRRHGSAVPK